MGTRRQLEQLAAHLTIKTGERHTMSRVLELAIELLARREKLERKAARR
jgi:hypothetical protein